MLFGPGFDQRKFLARYWQKRPLLIRAAGSFRDLVTPEILAGLACEPEVESRLVQYHGRQRWQQSLGPFKPKDFKQLGRRNWTLLVQAVDQWLPELQVLHENFSFLPSWRLEDIMVSFATAGGGVGPHFDYYDVFLIQGMGSRRWQVGRRCTHASPMDFASGLKLLRDFKATQEYLLQPGDVLYIPPRFAHYGIAKNDSLCYSIGFRAASLGEMIDGFSMEVASGLSQDIRYEDRVDHLSESPGEISPAMLADAFDQVRAALQEPQAFLRWFGCQVTQPRYPDRIFHQGTPVTVARLRRLLLAGARLSRNPCSRFAFGTGTRSLELFVDGECHVVPAGMRATLEQLCQVQQPGEELTGLALQKTEVRNLLCQLINQGSLLLQDQ